MYQHQHSNKYTPVFDRVFQGCLLPLDTVRGVTGGMTGGVVDCDSYHPNDPKDTKESAVPNPYIHPSISLQPDNPHCVCFTFDESSDQMHAAVLMAIIALEFPATSVMRCSLNKVVIHNEHPEVREEILRRYYSLTELSDHDASAVHYQVGMYLRERLDAAERDDM